MLIYPEHLKQLSAALRVLANQHSSATNIYYQVWNNPEATIEELQTAHNNFMRTRKAYYDLQETIKIFHTVT